jgi:hypothetical protein
MFNKDSGFVFLTNEDYQVAMINEDNNLVMFYSCPICGHEGFLESMVGEEHHLHDEECIEFVKSIKGE